MTTPEGRKAFNYSVRAPKGVIAVVCPWNLPLLLMTWKVAPALACGNTVVVKPSEETPATATLLGEVMQTVGVPSGVYNVVHGSAPIPRANFSPGTPMCRQSRSPAKRRTGAGHHEGAPMEFARIARARRQEPGYRIRPTANLDAATAGISARSLSQYRPNLPGNRAGLRGASDIRALRGRVERERPRP